MSVTPRSLRCLATHGKLTSMHGHTCPMTRTARTWLGTTPSRSFMGLRERSSAWLDHSSLSLVIVSDRPPSEHCLRSHFREAEQRSVTKLPRDLHAATVSIIGTLSECGDCSLVEGLVCSSCPALAVQWAHQPRPLGAVAIVVANNRRTCTTLLRVRYACLPMRGVGRAPWRLCFLT